MSFDRKNLQLTLHCKLSGLPIGKLELLSVAGAIPYMSHWAEATVLHPVFSLDPERLFRYARNEWNRIAQRDGEPSLDEANILQVSFLAILHTLDCVKQDIPALPPLDVVETHLQSLLQLAYWKWHLESQQFRFPMYHISPVNTNADFSGIGDYLDLCFDVRRQYQAGVQRTAEKAKERAADEAARLLADTWMKPISRRQMLKWIQANLPSRYKPDGEGWIATLFLGGPTAIVEYTDDESELQLMEDIILGECPPGTGMMKKVRERLEEIRKIWGDHHLAFEIVIEDQHEGAIENPGPAPEPSAFPNKAQFFQARARWQIAQLAWEKSQRPPAPPVSPLSRMI